MNFNDLFCSGVPTSSLTQVVHSAGRRFIVSPVPESRLRESKVFTSDISDPGKNDSAML
jgi:WNK lysine deficient protein kinase